MIKITTLDSSFGHIDVFTNEERSFLYAVPHGYVGPALVKKDLKFMNDFDLGSTAEWSYIVDTSKVKVVNPINPFLLKGLSRFSNMKEYVVYAPSPIVRLMIKLSAWINRPDRVIKKKEDLLLELQK